MDGTSTLTWARRMVSLDPSGGTNTITHFPQIPSPDLSSCRPTSSTSPRIGFDGLLGALGVPLVRADRRSLARRRPPESRLRRIVFFFDTGVSRSHRTLLLTLCISPLLSQHLSGFSSSRRLFHPIRRSTRICATWLSHHPHVHTLILAGSPRHSVHIQKTPRVSFSHAQAIQYLSFLLAPTIFIHSGS